VRLLFDENVSPRLCGALQDLYPDSLHVRNVGLDAAGDGDVWSYASANGFAVVTKDADFRQRSFLFGPPPKVIWLRLGNGSTKAIEALMRRRAESVADFLLDDEKAFLALS
jgi:predicted nuclease of predicted toxin-antitoxin system